METYRKLTSTEDPFNVDMHHASILSEIKKMRKDSTTDPCLYSISVTLQ
jgi:hypothetical protein